MPANHGATPNWHPSPDLFNPDRYQVTPQYAVPQSQSEIRDWLEDIGASAHAEANQFVDPAVSAEILDEMALRVYEDVQGGYFPLEIAVQRQQARELGYTAFSYIEYTDGRREAQAS